MITILLGILSSTIAEAITWLNKKLAGTVLKGDGAFLIALVLALAGAIVKEVTTPGFTVAHLSDWQSLSTTFGEVFTVSQVYFMFVVKKLGLDIQQPTA